MAKQPLYIYVLKDPRDSSVRYVGSTIRIESALSRHITRPTNKRKLVWITELQNQGFKPELEVIAETSTRDGKATEEYWINYYHDLGANLLNGIYTYRNGRKHHNLHPSWEKHSDEFFMRFAALLSQYEPIPEGIKHPYNRNYLTVRAFEIAIEALRQREKG